MVGLMPMAPRQFTDSNGDPLVGGKVGYYVPGTGGGQLQAVWADQGQTIPLTNPVPLDSAGRTFSGGSQIPVWGTGQYQEIVYDRHGQVVTSNVVAISDAASALAEPVIAAQAPPKLLSGSAIFDSAGVANIPFNPAFNTVSSFVAMSLQGLPFTTVYSTTEATLTLTTPTTAPSGAAVNWIAVGS